MITKIYFIEDSFDYNGENLNDDFIAGSEKTLINITNELGKNKNLLIKVFNKTSVTKIINNVYWHNISQIDKTDKPDFLISIYPARKSAVGIRSFPPWCYHHRKAPSRAKHRKFLHRSAAQKLR